MDTPNALSILLIPGILIIFAALLYGSAYAKGLRDENLPKSRWIGVALLALAALVGIRYVWLLVNPSMGAFYRASLGSRKTVASHYVALIAPLILLAGVWGLELLHKKLGRDNR